MRECFYDRINILSAAISNKNLSNDHRNEQTTINKNAIKKRSNINFKRQRHNSQLGSIRHRILEFNLHLVVEVELPQKQKHSEERRQQFKANNRVNQTKRNE